MAIDAGRPGGAPRPTRHLGCAAGYIFSAVPHWREEIAAMVMVWAVYMGAALCVRERFHIRIVVAVKALPTGFGRIVIFIADIFWAAFRLMMMRVPWDFLEVAWEYTSLRPSPGITSSIPRRS